MVRGYDVEFTSNAQSSNTPVILLPYVFCYAGADYLYALGCFSKFKDMRAYTGPKSFLLSNIISL